MKKSLFLCGAFLLAVPGLSTATDYPLTFKTLDAQQALSFPSGSSTYTMLQTSKPAGIVKAPPAVSQHPLYGQIAAGSEQLLFRMDESKGTGQGYDRLIVDVNRNGDLTGAPVVSPVPADRRNGVVVVSPQQILFGPIQAPESLKIGTDRPVFFAQVYMLTTPQMIANMAANMTVNMTIGEIMVRPGWYLQATVQVDGKQHKIGYVDADCNFKLGDPEKPVIARVGVNGAETSWYFQGGDRILVDWDGPQTIQSTLLGNQSSPFGPLLYLDAKPYKATLSADFKTLSLEPWAEPMAELALQTHGEQVNNLELGWEKAPGDWVLLQAGVANGKVKVPPGNYRLYAVGLKANSSSGDSLIMSGTKRVPEGGIKAMAGESTPLKCGAPLKLELTATATRDSGLSSSGSLLSSILGQSGPAQTIQATLFGAGGETYSTPYLLGANGAARQPQAPTYTVLTTDGKQVDSGNLEYG